MLRLRCFFVGVFILTLCAGGLVHAAQSEDAPLVAPDNTRDNTKKETADTPAGLRKLSTPPALMQSLQGAPVTNIPKVWPALVIAAGPYARFIDIVKQAAQMPPDSADDLERLMADLSVFDGPKLSKSFHAQAVLWAMQAPGFAAGVESWGRMYNRRQIIANLHINPAYVEQMPGYIQARNQVLKTIREDGDATIVAGGMYKDLAYSLQGLKWANKVRGGKALRLAALRNAHLAPQIIPEYLLLPLERAYALQAPNTPAGYTAFAALPAQTSTPNDFGRSIGPNSAIVALTASAPAETKETALAVAPSRQGELRDILATAALHILDQNAPYPTTLPPRNTPDMLAECVDWARLHLNQCVAATRYVYEDSFCIARHQLKDTGRCIAEFIDGPQVATH